MRTNPVIRAEQRMRKMIMKIIEVRIGSGCYAAPFSERWKVL